MVLPIPTNLNLSNVQIVTNNGQFTCNPAPYTITTGMAITVSGTNQASGPGAIAGYTNPTIYFVLSTNGSTSFTLTTFGGGAGITTSTGTPTATFTMPGLPISSADYNTIQSEINSTLGVGSGNRGYGQTVTSASVAANNLITAQHLINLKTDLDKISFHQTDTASTAPTISQGGLITASNWNSYYTQAIDLSSSALRYRIFGVATESPLITNQSTWTLDVVTSEVTNWNGNKTHSITVDFGTENAARYFFNTGGEIRIVPRHRDELGTLTKGGRWKSMFTFLGARGVRIGANATTAPTSTTTYNATTYVGGYYQLTSTMQKVYDIIDTGTYSGNDFTVNARVSSPLRYLYIDCLFRDDGNYGARDDEFVEGTTTSSVGIFRATGSYVTVALPSVTAPNM